MSILSEEMQVNVIDVRVFETTIVRTLGGSGSAFSGRFHGNLTTTRTEGVFCGMVVVVGVWSCQVKKSGEWPSNIFVNLFNIA